MKPFTKTEEGFFICPYCHVIVGDADNHVKDCYDYVKAEKDYYKNQLKEKEYTQQKWKDHINFLLEELSQVKASCGQLEHRLRNLVKEKVNAD